MKKLEECINMFRSLRWFAEGQASAYSKTGHGIKADLWTAKRDTLDTVLRELKEIDPNYLNGKDPA